MTIKERGPDFMGHNIYWRDDDDEGFRLEMFVGSSETQRESSRLRWGYVFWDDRWDRPVRFSPFEPIFSGFDYEVPDFEDDPKKIVAGLLGWLSLQTGDTDAEFFDNYTEKQKAWMEDRAALLSMYAYELAEWEGDWAESET